MSTLFLMVFVSMMLTGFSVAALALVYAVLMYTFKTEKRYVLFTCLIGLYWFTYLCFGLKV